MKVLLVGHCLPDRVALSRAVRRALPEAAADGVNSDRALQKALGSASLLLVNRALDGRFSDDDGVALIVRLVGAGAPPMMLISDHADAQAAAVAAGALEGFGKAALRGESTAQRLRAAAGPRQ